MEIYKITLIFVKLWDKLNRTVRALSRVLVYLSKKIFESPLYVSILIFFLVFPLVFAPSFKDYSDPAFQKNILVEAHGMLLDILILGILASALNRIGEKRQRIQRYREEIEDYLGWDAPEAAYRIAGNIKRLNREKVSNIFLSRAFLCEANLAGINLSEADLRDANLTGTHIIGARLVGANLIFADLSRASLNDANLSNTDLWGTDFNEAFLSGANLSGANLKDAVLSGAKYNIHTIWPDDFDPVAAGAILVE